MIGAASPILTGAPRPVRGASTKERRLSSCSLQGDRRFRSMRATSAGSHVTGIHHLYSTSPAPCAGALLVCGHLLRHFISEGGPVAQPEKAAALSLIHISEPTRLG